MSSNSSDSIDKFNKTINNTPKKKIFFSYPSIISFDIESIFIIFLI